MQTASASPLIAFLVPTGRPDKEQIRKKLKPFIAQGIKQFLIYPRDGIGYKHLSEEWFAMWADFVSVAKEEGAQLWIYDDLWPSGRAAEDSAKPGRILQGSPELAAQTLAAFQAPDGAIEWKLSRSILQADLLNPKATAKFISTTHEIYAQRFGSEFGKCIVGLFTDEPSYYHNNCGLVGGEGLKVRLPFYDGLEEDYAKLTGSALRPDIEAIVRGAGDPRKTWPTVYSLLGKRFASAYFAQLRSWCESRNLKFTGHLCDEMDNGAVISMQGNPFTCLKEFSLPGVDEIKTALIAEKIIWATWKLGQSTIEQEGRGGITEIFALGPVDLSMAKMRLMIYLAAFHGVDNYVMAISPFDLRGGMRRQNFLSSISPMQPWFAWSKALAEESVKAAELAGKEPPPSIFLRFPESEWAVRQGSMPSGWGPPLPFGEAFQNAIRALSMAQWPVRIIDEKEELGSRKALLDVSLNGSAFTAKDATGRSHEFASMDELKKFLEAKFTRQLSARLPDGSLAKNILLECSADGRDFMALNLSDTPSPELTLSNALTGQCFMISLPPFGVASSKDLPAIAQMQKRKSVNAGCKQFKLALTSPNHMRCTFKNSGAGRNVCSFKMEDGMDRPVRIVLRKELAPSTLSLDGKTLSLAKQCSSLPDGMAELYAETEALPLEPGIHELRFDGPNEDRTYLPLCFLSGDFGAFDDNRLAPLPAHAALGANLRELGLLNYCGQIKLIGRIAVPRDAEAIQIDVGDDSASLSINGKELGPKCWQPCRWKLPKETIGAECEAEITIGNSLGPLFGSFDGTCAGQTYKDLHWLKEFWPAKKQSGVNLMEFILN